MNLDLDSLFGFAEDMEESAKKDTSIIEKFDALQEEMAGVSESMEEVPSEIVKKWLEDLCKISTQYKRAKRVEWLER